MAFAPPVLPDAFGRSALGIRFRHRERSHSNDEQPALQGGIAPPCQERKRSALRPRRRRRNGCGTPGRASNANQYSPAAVMKPMIQKNMPTAAERLTQRSGSKRKLISQIELLRMRAA